MKNLYYYTFYRFYKMISSMEIEFWNVWRAGSLVLTVEIFLFFIICIPIVLISGVDFLSKELITVFVIVNAIKAYLSFDRNDNWKRIVQKFDEAPSIYEKRNKTIFWLVIICLIPIFAFELFIVGKIRGTI